MELLNSSSSGQATGLADIEFEPLSPHITKKIWNREMATLYLTEQGATVYKEHQRFIIWMPEQENKIEIPIREVERILVFGNIQLSTQAIGACLQQPIIVLFMNSSGQYKGHLWSLESTHLASEMVQIEKHQNSRFQLSLCRAIVRGKLMNSRQLLMRLNRKRYSSEVEAAIAGIQADIQAVDKVRSLDKLRGYEGIGAARYFPAFGQLITHPAFTFTQRNRQPPTDPVNSLLSFGYTLLFNNVLSLIITEGLSPYLGHFYYGDDKKTYLAFDLMEEFRSPIVDSLVLKLINNSIFKPDDFDWVADTGGVYLNYDARKVFLQNFEQRMNDFVSHPDIQSQVTYRQVIQLQVRRYKRTLWRGVAYEPFLRVT